MDLNSIVKNYSDEKKEMIVNYAELNKEKMHLNNEYHSAALNLFFELWHNHFPSVKQSKSCRGCRKSVCHFFHKIADFIVSEKDKKAEVLTETAKPKSKAKAKKKVLSKK